MTLYDLKPRFQGLLRPIVAAMAARGITANQVTVAAAAGSVLLGFALGLWGEARALFLLLPVWLFLRMALNAVDGMLAREFGQKSDLGAYLNEIGDIVSDAALYLPFTLVAPFNPGVVVLVVLLLTLTEVAGILGVTVGASRRYDGPMGKSDRALVFGALGLWVGLGLSLPDWTRLLLWALAALLTLTIVNRVRKGLGSIGA